MATSMAPARPLAGLKRALRQCRFERQQQVRCLSQVEHPSAESSPVEQSLSRRPPIAQTSQTAKYPSLQPLKNFGLPEPTPGFRPSQAIKQNRFEPGLRKIPNFPPPRSTAKICKDPVGQVLADQLKVLDPTGARTRLFDDANPERVQPGDILLVRLKSGDPFAGVCLSIRRRNSPIDTAVLLRNQLTRVGVEMWYKVYSPNVEGIEIVQRKQKRARRARLYYMRKPKHDMGSVENIVLAYQRSRLGGPVGGRKSGNKKKGRQ